MHTNVQICCLYNRLSCTPDFKLKHSILLYDDTTALYNVTNVANVVQTVESDYVAQLVLQTVSSVGRF